MLGPEKSGMTEDFIDRNWFDADNLLFEKVTTTLVGPFICWAHVASLTCKANVQSTSHT